MSDNEQDEFEPIDEETSDFLASALDAHGFSGLLEEIADIANSASEAAVSEDSDDEAADYIALMDLIRAAAKKATELGL